MPSKGQVVKELRGEKNPKRKDPSARTYDETNQKRKGQKNQKPPEAPLSNTGGEGRDQAKTSLGKHGQQCEPDKENCQANIKPIKPKNVKTDACRIES